MKAKILTVVSAAAIAAGLALIPAGVADAHTASKSVTQKGTATTPVQFQPLVGTVTATYRVVDSGKSVRVIGSAKGLDPAATYVGLIYPDDTCSTAETPANLAVFGEFQELGDAQRDVFGEYDGTAYAAVKGKIGSVSVRRVDLVFVPGAPGTPGVVTTTLTPAVCVDVK